MTILLQVLFSIMVALIVVHMIGWLIRKVNTEVIRSPTFVRGLYASAAVCTFVLSFHEVSRVATF